LCQDATPYHAQAFPIPKVHEHTLWHEVDRLCQLGVLKKVNRSEWAAPIFIIPKKDDTVKFISNSVNSIKGSKENHFPSQKSKIY
jgi:hypothetical protein